MKELQPGQRVRFYDGSRSWTGTVEPVVDSPNFPGGVLVRRDKPIEGRFLSVLVHEKQCRRLKPKKKTGPEKRVECWAVVTEQREMLMWAYTERGAALNIHGKRESVHLTEIRKGEVIVDKEKVAEAWHATPGGYDFIDRFCDALMLGVAKEKP